MAELLSVRDLRVEFGTEHGLARVLDGISLDIAPGEVVGLVGESGCGKTTLARAILGVLPSGVARIGGGAIRFQGRDLLVEDRHVVNREVRGRAITVIPQDPYTSFNPVFTVGAQIMELMKWKSPRAPGRGRGSWPAVLCRYPRRRYRSDREAALDMLRAVQIPDPERAFRRLPHEFSGGQRQRLMIAMALLPNPALIIADEPTTALDVTIQAQILKLLRALVKERRVSVLFTTHDLGTAYEICDRIVVMYAGQEMEAAPTAAFFERPAHPYTRRLLESLPTPGQEIRDIPGEVPSLIAPPTGCRFHPRCEAATTECRGQRPYVRDVGFEHRVHCYHPVADAPTPAAPPTAATGGRP
jgi:peptide/nickel transport system ATP-binding protein